MNIDKSIDHYSHRATKTIPGGVNSPVRAFKSVGGTPYFYKKQKALIYMMRMETNT